MPTLTLAIDARRARQGAAEFERATGQVTKSTTSANVALAKLGTALAAAFSARDVIRTISGFEETLATVRGVTKATDDQFRALTATARELGATTRFSAQQAGEGLLFLARAGFSTRDSIDALRGTLALAQAGSIELGQAADFASNIVSAFGFAASETSRVVDVLVATSNRANTSVSQAADAMKVAAPIARQFGVSLEEASAAVGKLGDSGVQGAEAGTQLRGVLLSLVDPSDTAEAGLRTLGLTAAEVDPVANGLTTVLERLKGGLDSVSDSQAATALSQIFGARRILGASVLAEATEGIRALTEANIESAGEATELARIMDDTLSGALKAFRSAVEEAYLSLGEAGLGGGFREVVEAATDTVRALAGAEQGFTGSAERAKFLAESIKVGAIALTSYAAVIAGTRFGTFAAGLAASAAETAKLTAAVFTNAAAQQQQAAAKVAAIRADIAQTTAQINSSRAFLANSVSVQGNATAHSARAAVISATIGLEQQLVVQTTALTAAQARLAAAQTGASTAMSAAGVATKGLVGFLTGPVGLSLAIAGVVAYLTTVESATEKWERTLESLTLTVDEASQALSAYEAALKRTVDARIAGDLEAQRRAYLSVADAIEQGVDQLQDLLAEQGRRATVEVGVVAQFTSTDADTLRRQLIERIGERVAVELELTGTVSEDLAREINAVVERLPNVSQELLNRLQFENTATRGFFDFTGLEQGQATAAATAEALEDLTESTGSAEQAVRAFLNASGIARLPVTDAIELAREAQGKWATSSLTTAAALRGVGDSSEDAAASVRSLTDDQLKGRRALADYLTELRAEVSLIGESDGARARSTALLDAERLAVEAGLAVEQDLTEQTLAGIDSREDLLRVVRDLTAEYERESAAQDRAEQAARDRAAAQSSLLAIFARTAGELRGLQGGDQALADASAAALQSGGGPAALAALGAVSVALDRVRQAREDLARTEAQGAADGFLRGLQAQREELTLTADQLELVRVARQAEAAAAGLSADERARVVAEAVAETQAQQEIRAGLAAEEQARRDAAQAAEEQARSIAELVRVQDQARAAAAQLLQQIDLETRALALTNDERQRAAVMARLHAEAVGLEADELALLEAQVGASLDVLQDQQRARGTAEAITGPLVQGLGQAIFQAESLEEALENIAPNLGQSLFDNLVLQPLADQLAASLTGVFGGADDALGGAALAASATTAATALSAAGTAAGTAISTGAAAGAGALSSGSATAGSVIAQGGLAAGTALVSSATQAAAILSAAGATSSVAGIASARGNIFTGSSRLVPFAAGGITGQTNTVGAQPFTFPLAGGATGLAREAGPEAILPARNEGGGQFSIGAMMDGSLTRVPLTRGPGGQLMVDMGGAKPFARGDVIGGEIRSSSSFSPTRSAAAPEVTITPSISISVSASSPAASSGGGRGDTSSDPAANIVAQLRDPRVRRAIENTVAESISRGRSAALRGAVREA